MTTSKKHTTTLSLTLEDRHRIDALRLMRATERGELPGTMQAIVTQAIREYLERELPLT